MQERRKGDRRRSLEGYKREITHKIGLLNEVFAAASQGDFSRDVPKPKHKDEFSSLYHGVQAMLDVIRQKVAELERANSHLEDQVQEATEDSEQSDEILRSVFENASNFILVLDRNLNIIFANRVVTGAPTETLIGRRFLEFVPLEQDRRRIEKILRRVLATGKAAEYEATARGPEDSRAFYHTNAGPIFRNGRVAGMALIATDITVAKKAQEALAQRTVDLERSNKFTNLLLNSIGEGLIVVDDEAYVISINPAAAEMLGVSPDGLKGKWLPGAVPAMREGKLIAPNDRLAVKSMAKGETVTGVTEYMRKDGSLLPVMITISPVVMEGKVIGAIEVFRDISRERELEVAKEEFVALASHQLRTPATGIKAYASMLLDGYAGEMTGQQKGYLSQVYETNERQLQIIGDLLNVARLDSGRLIPEMKPVDLCDLIRRVLKEQRPVIRKRHQTIKVYSPPRPARVMVDASLMSMMLENLLSNASKYTPEGGRIKLSASLSPTGVGIDIEDSGVGIAKQDISRIFDRFTRLDNELGLERGGTGLGLYLAANIAKLHGASIEVVSRPGIGSTFKVRLPASRIVVDRLAPKHVRNAAVNRF